LYYAFEEGCGVLPGFIIGAASGAVQFWLLLKFTNAVTRGDISYKVAVFAISQFLLPIVVLICCALLLYQSLLFTGIGMTASLIICAVARFLSKYTPQR